MKKVSRKTFNYGLTIEVATNYINLRWFEVWWIDIHYCQIAWEKIVRWRNTWHGLFSSVSYGNLNPVLLARHLQYKFEQLFKIIVLGCPLHKVKYHAIQIGYQVRGWPQFHSFSWVYDTPVLTTDNIPEYVLFVHCIIKASLPDIETTADLYDLVVTYQIHDHSK